MAHSVEILVPAQRYVFALENGEAEPQPAATSAEGFKSYKRLQSEGKVAGMVAFPNCCLIRTHAHFDHVEALVEFTQRETYVHEIELEAPYTAFVQSVIDMVQIRKLSG